MNILAFLNAYTKGASGGDVLFAKLMHLQKKVIWHVVTSHQGKSFCKNHKLHASYIITTKEKRFGNVIGTYIQRILRGLIIRIPPHIDIIYSSSDALPDTIPAFVAAIRTRKPWVARTYHIVSNKRIVSRITQELSIQLMRFRADAIVTASHQMKQDLMRRGINPTKIHIQYPGYTRHSKPDKQSRSNIDATFMGRLHPSKGIFELVEIWAEVVKKYPGTKLTVIGTGEETHINQLRRKIEEYGLQGSITLCGFLPDTEAFSLISQSKVFVYPSHEEGFGLVIAEILSLGTPIVAYDLPVFKELFHEYISLIPSFDISLFVDYIKHILDNPQQNKPIALPQFSWEKALRQEQTILNEITA